MPSWLDGGTKKHNGLLIIYLFGRIGPSHRFFNLGDSRSAYHQHSYQKQNSFHLYRLLVQFFTSLLVHWLISSLVA
jgi:hypothetical protein